MGKAARRRAAGTLDGGPPSDDQIMLQLEVFNPLAGFLEGEPYRTAVIEMAKKLHSRPTPICGACTYEFAYGECPPAIYVTKPMFPKAEDYVFIAGAICPRCAALPPEELLAAINKYLRVVRPDLTVIEMGTA